MNSEHPGGSDTAITDAPVPYRVGAWRVEPALNRLTDGERRVRVKPKSMAVLQRLSEHPGSVLSRRAIMDGVWPGQVVSEEVLTQAIAELRRAVGDDPRHPRFIETVPRQGYRLVAPVVADGELPGHAWRATPLAGREAEQTRLHEALGRAAAGSGAVVLIGGEPGIGKTRLAAEIRDQARNAAFVTLEGRCPEEGGLPYLPFVMILEQLVQAADRSGLQDALGDAAPEIARLVPRIRALIPDLPPPLRLPADQERRLLFNAVQDALAKLARQSPLCLVIDDLHWAGPGSVGLLRHLLPALAALPVLLVGTYRSTELEGNPAFLGALEWVIRERLAERMDVGDLARDEVSAMLASLARSAPPEHVVSAFLEITNGNPFYVEELFRYLSATQDLLPAPGQWTPQLRLEEGAVPEGVRLVIRRRVGRLAATTRALLRAAAVQGRGFRLDWLREVLGLPADALVAALDEAEQARVIRADRRHHGFVFEHDLVRHALLGELSEARRCQLHLDWARALEGLGDPDRADAPAGEIARHLVAAGGLADPRALLGWSVRAGDQALEAAAFDDALAHFDRAAGLADGSDGILRARIAHQRGDALRGLERWDEAMATWHEAVDGYERAGDAEGASVTIDYLLAVTVWAGEWAAGRALASRGLGLTGDEPSAARHRILCHLPLLLEATNAGDGADEALGEIRRLAEQLDDDTALGKTLLHEGGAAWIRMTPGRNLDLLRQCIAVNHRARNLWDLPVAIWLYAAGLLCSGDWKAVETLVADSDPMIVRAGHRMAQAMCHHSRDWARLLRTGDIARFERHARMRAEEIRRLLGHPGLSALDQGLARYWRGDWDTARAVLAEAVEETLWPYTDSVRAATLRLLAHRRPDHCADALDALAPDPLEMPRIHPQWRLLACAVEAWAALDRRAPAAAAYEPLCRGHRDLGAVVLLYSEQLFERILGIAAAAGGRWNLARDHFELALRQADDLPNVIDRPEVRRWYAWMLLSRNQPGDRDRARGLLETAVAEFRALGMDRHAALAVDCLSGI